MRSRNGFTIVELLVTMTIMVILMTLVVVRLSTTQAGGRDRERATDISAISKGLETYYRNGSTDGTKPAGNYPGATEINAAKALASPFNNFLDGVPVYSFEAPGKTPATSFGVDPAADAGTNPDGSYTTTQADTLLSTIPYLYQPLQRDNSFCSNQTNCVKFNLYYKTELDSEIHTIRSLNQ